MSEWKLRRISHGTKHDTWLLEHCPSAQYNAGRDYANEIAYHLFDGPDAEKRARFALRDKCIRSALTAALASA